MSHTKLPLRRCLALSIASLLPVLALAGGPRSVNGAGVPLAWPTGSAITYNPDQGPLGQLSNSAARTLLASAFAEWAAVGVVSFSEGSLLPVDVNAAGDPGTNPAHWRNFYRVDGDGRSPIIFDQDGAIIASLFGSGAQFDILGVAGLDTPIGASTQITGASAIINGAFIDGAGLPGSPDDITTTAMKAVMVHEIGHFLNLDHTVNNHELALDGEAATDVYVPTMYPIAVTDEEALATLNPDDEMALRMLYDPAASTTSVSGSIFVGSVPFQGANVVLRRSGDPLMTSYSVISGDLYFPCNAGGSCDCTLHNCPPNPPLQGSYAALHLAPGSYSVCVEQIDTRFTQASGTFVGPLATPATLPGPEECWQSGESASDDPDDRGTVSGNATGIDIQVNALPVVDALEPNNSLASPATLEDLPGGRDTLGALLGAGDLDVYAVPVVAGQRIRVDIDAAEVGSTLDAVVGFYDAANHLVLISDDALDPDSSAPTFDPAFEVVASFTGTAKLVVSSFPDLDQDGSGGGSTGPYWLRVEVVSDADADGIEDGLDPCPADPENDRDHDGFCVPADNCPALANPTQTNSDADPLGDACDNCPGVTNPTQSDDDGDGTGNACEGDDDGDSIPDGSDPCPDDPQNDADGDGRCAGSDNCPQTANAGQQDADADGAGDACDFCATNQLHREDRIARLAGNFVQTLSATNDGRYAVFTQNRTDLTPPWRLYSVPLFGGTPVELAATNAEPVFLRSANSKRIVFRVALDSAAIELYSVSVTGGDRIKLNPPLVSGGNVSAATIAPDSNTVVYLADQDIDTVVEAYSIPIAGGTVRKLNPPFVLGRSVNAFRISGDSKTVVYLADQDANDDFEIFKVPIRGGVPAQVNGPLVATGDVLEFFVSPDSKRVVYRAIQDTAGIDELYSASLASGTVTKLNPPMVSGGSIINPGAGFRSFLFTINSQRVVYAADQEVLGKRELYSVPIGGGTAIKLSGTMIAAGGVGNFRGSGGGGSLVGSRVTFIADRETDEVFELYSADVTTGAITKLSAPLVSGGDVADNQVSLDDTWVVYSADQEVDERPGLYRVPLAGGTVVNLAPGYDNNGYAILNDSKSVIYFAQHDTPAVDEAYSVPILGGTPTKLNRALGTGGDVNIVLVPVNPSYVLYTAFPDTPTQAVGSVNDGANAVPSHLDVQSVAMNLVGTNAIQVAFTLAGALPASGDARVNQLCYRAYVDLEAPFIVEGDTLDAEVVWEVCGNASNAYAVPNGAYPLQFSIAGNTLTLVTERENLNDALQFGVYFAASDTNEGGSPLDTTSPIVVTLPAQTNELFTAVTLADSDADTVVDFCDRCTTVSDPLQTDTDGDGVGNACDNCPTVPNASQADYNADGLGDACAPGPHVLAMFPPDGTVDVALSTTLVLLLSDPVDPATANAETVRLSIGGVKVAGSVQVSADGRTASFDPAEPLTPSTHYVLEVTSSLKDPGGNATTPFLARFSTVSNPSSGTLPAAQIGEQSGGAAITSQNADDNSGFAVAALGDVDGDGNGDLIVGAPNADVAAAVDAGKATLVFGGPALQSNATARTIVVYQTGSAGELVGESVARAGDLNHDGIGDFLIAAPHAASGTGTIYLVFGAAGLHSLPATPLDLTALPACAAPTSCGVIFHGEVSLDTAGLAMSFAGDIDADGNDDLLLGAPGASPGGRTGAGKVYLIYGPLGPGSIDLSTVGSSRRGLVFRGESAGDAAGSSVSHWRDPGAVDDLLIGAPGAVTVDETGHSILDSGYVYGIQGGRGPGKLDDSATPGVIELNRVANGLANQVAGMVFLGTRPNGRLGRSLTGSVDTNGDGINDVIIAGNGIVFAIPGDGPKTVTGGTRTGAAADVQPTVARSLGALAALDALRDFGATRYQEQDELPLVVSGTNDVDHDGVQDFIIGSPLADAPAGVDAGKAYIVLGSRAPGGAERSLSEIGTGVPGLVVDGAEAGDHLGASVSGGFDLNGDGVEDALVGAPFADSAASPQNSGTTYVISPIRPDEVLDLRLARSGGGTLLEWRVPDLAASYNVYRGVLSVLRSARIVRTSDMTHLACDTHSDSNGNLLPDLVDPTLPAVGEGLLYLVTARNVNGEGPPGSGTPARVNDAQCP